MSHPHYCFLFRRVHDMPLKLQIHDSQLTIQHSLLSPGTDSVMWGWVISDTLPLLSQYIIMRLVSYNIRCLLQPFRLFICIPWVFSPHHSFINLWYKVVLCLFARFLWVAFSIYLTPFIMQIVDRPTQSHVFLSREYVQPQWVFDCVNAHIILPTEGYLVGRYVIWGLWYLLL